ncbi:DUF1330 domain-containing protein [Celerinatantimonas sp. YJH-8]|uniref:DUF1330 domain-containing protein n=1 Tax=Celerinatantimonas sp. YJH-8 TaxID=3228714 RepID=UPI0038C34AB6
MADDKPAYIIFDVNVENPEGMIPYQQQVAATIQAFKGRKVVLGAPVETLEGQPSQGNLVILQFDSLTQAKAWHASPEYQAILPYRQASAKTNAWLVEGFIEPIQ